MHPRSQEAVVDLLDPVFGAPRDGASPCDEALARAAAALGSGGGRVVFPPDVEYAFDSVDMSELAAPLTLDFGRARIHKLPPSRGGRRFHLFHDQTGGSDDLRVLGGTIDLRAGDFAVGETVSAFFGIRANGWLFRGMRVHNGIEEGVKLYKPRGVRVLWCDFETIRNNGVQLHCPQHDGYRGQKPDRGTESCLVVLCRFVGIDDGAGGAAEGQAVSVSSTSDAVQVRDVTVRNCYARACVRGPWAEFNPPASAGVGVRFLDNLVEDSVAHGTGMIGVQDGAMVGNRIVDPGRRGSRSGSEVLGVVVGGSTDLRSSGVTIDRNTVVDTRSPPLLEHGIVVRQADDVEVGPDNVVRGVAGSPVRVDPASTRDVRVRRRG